MFVKNKYDYCEIKGFYSGYFWHAASLIVVDMYRRFGGTIASILRLDDEVVYGNGGVVVGAR